MGYLHGLICIVLPARVTCMCYLHGLPVAELIGCGGLLQMLAELESAGEVHVDGISGTLKEMDLTQTQIEKLLLLLQVRTDSDSQIATDR